MSVEYKQLGLWDIVPSNPTIREMKRLVICRHGEYGYGGRLDNEGKSQIRSLSGRLRQIFNPDNETALILSSTAPRAVDSATILAEAIKAPVEKYPDLWSDSNHDEDIDAVLRLIKAVQSRADMVVIVTHLEYTEDLPVYIGRRELGKRLRRKALDKGEGIVLDYRNKTISYL